jgi:hypothetical protein
MQRFRFLLVVLVGMSLPGMAQETKIIQLKPQSQHVRLVHYHVTGVKDDRADTTNIGVVRAKLFSKKSVNLNLPGGPAKAIGAYVAASPQASDSVAIVLHIVQLEAAEQTGGLKAQSELKMKIAFYDGENKLIEYSSDNTVDAKLDATKYIEEMIRKGVDDMLQQFDEHLGKGLKVKG